MKKINDDFSFDLQADMKKHGITEDDIVKCFIDEIGFDSSLAHSLLGREVKCIESHRGVESSAIGYVCAVEEMDAGFSFVRVDWDGLGKSDDWVYSKREFFSFVTVDSNSYR